MKNTERVAKKIRVFFSLITRKWSELGLWLIYLLMISLAYQKSFPKLSLNLSKVKFQVRYDKMNLAHLSKVFNKSKYSYTTYISFVSKIIAITTQRIMDLLVGISLNTSKSLWQTFSLLLMHQQKSVENFENIKNSFYDLLYIYYHISLEF